MAFRHVGTAWVARFGAISVLWGAASAAWAIGSLSNLFPFLRFRIQAISFIFSEGCSIFVYGSRASRIGPIRRIESEAPV